ncbi:MAG: hypothetical protein BEN18_04835 [Epulopiscium sp. Nuni2H_MBin001]|nr:MAG: hypothetical protein BEN18_04835 [Epulopiscium sp. Nuni2H_MBin001]
MRIGLYVHVPFCNAKCYYCDFLSFTNKGLEERYVQGLLRELTYYSKLIDGVHTIGSVFIGGGTPSVLPPFLLQQICRGIEELFNLEDDMEWTIEANPESLSNQQLDVIHNSRINRVSLGLQSTNNKLLKTLGRIHSFEDWKQSVAKLTNIGIKHINTDLMFDLPGQTLSDWEKTLLTIIQYPIDHISCYALILEENTFFHKCYTKDEDNEVKMYKMAKDILSRYDYSQYEISNWAKAGCECVHNVLYWQLGSYIGAGLGASGYLFNRRYTNTSDMKQYLAASHLTDLDVPLLDVPLIEETIMITPRMSQEEFMFLGLRMTNGVSKKQFYHIFNTQIEDVFKPQIDRWVQQKALINKEDRLYLTSYGVDISNVVFSTFLE